MILFLVPRIVLIEQNVRRLQRYGIPDDHIGIYYGEHKEIREITISTYQSAINNYNLIRRANMVILDEVHLVSESAVARSEEHTSELQSRQYLVCCLLLAKKTSLTICYKTSVLKFQMSIYKFTHQTRPLHSSIIIPRS